MADSIASTLVLACICAGSLTGATERLIRTNSYDQFLNDPESYHLVDGLGNPVRQEAE